MAGSRISKHVKCILIGNTLIPRGRLQWVRITLRRRTSCRQEQTLRHTLPPRCSIAQAGWYELVICCPHRHRHTRSPSPNFCGCAARSLSLSLSLAAAAGPVMRRRALSLSCILAVLALAATSAASSCASADLSQASGDVRSAGLPSIPRGIAATPCDVAEPRSGPASAECAYT